MSAKPKIHSHKGRRFGVTRESDHSARVGLICKKHEHGDVLVRYIFTGEVDWVEDFGRDPEAFLWAVGRELVGCSVGGGFSDAVERAAKLLAEECDALGELAEFFGDEDGKEAREKIVSHGGREYLFTNEGSVAARVEMRCNRHEHQPYLVGLTGYEVGAWLTGRAKGQGAKYRFEYTSEEYDDGAFAAAVSSAISLLDYECDAMGDMEGFFGEG